MNTPKPCDTCTHCYWNILYEECEDDSAECLLNMKMGNPACEHYEQRCCLPMRETL